MILWMLYSAVVALLVVAAARAAEWLARLAGYRVRWIWAGALALTVFLSASAVFRETQPIALATTASPVSGRGEAVHAQTDASWLGALRVRIESVRRSLDEPLRDVAANLYHAVSPAANVYAASLSLALSLGLTLVLVGVGRRFRRAQREWPLVTMEGVGVRVAPHIGPLVLGVVRPEIVVPRWLLGRRADEQRLVVTHEDEHVRARDPLLLGLAWGAVVIAPWNPGVWYMLSRLRLAVELDCDARVLRRGAIPRSYGSLLIDVAQHASPFRLSALALADDSSHLRQRILAMKPSIPRFARVRGGLAAAFALAGILAACQATLPTDAEIERMDVAAATRLAQKLSKGNGAADTALAYTIDGAKATIAEAEALASSEISGVQVVTETAGKPTKIDIITRKALSAAAAGDSGHTSRTTPTADAPGALAGNVPRRSGSAEMNKASFTGIIFIDGARSTESQMKSLDRTQIESVEILKGQAAAEEFGAEAANGVIVIKTKRSGSGK